MISPKKNNCCGCGACVSVCPTQAIKLTPDKLGFLYPTVNTRKCVNCEKCDRICPLGEDAKPTESPIRKVFAARNKDIATIEGSRSGGIFPALAQKVIEQGGVVYGAGFGNNFSVKHKRAETIEAIQELRGSKYSQSDMTGIYQLVKQDLQNGRMVLFSGTACQISGLLRTIGSYHKNNLILVDIICHGVSSPAVWQDYLDFIKRKEHKPLVEVCFRDKKIFGWSGIHKESFVFSNGKRKTYDYNYYSDLHMRECCHECHFASLDRVSDITLGDFWGWEKCCPPNFNSDDRGCSLIICNTDFGLAHIEGITNQVYLIPVDSNDYIQPNLQYPTPKSELADDFQRDYIGKGFRYVRRHYGVVGLKYQWLRVINFLKRHLK